MGVPQGSILTPKSTSLGCHYGIGTGPSSFWAACLARLSNKWVCWLPTEIAFPKDWQLSFEQHFWGRIFVERVNTVRSVRLERNIRNQVLVQLEDLQSTGNKGYARPIAGFVKPTSSGCLSPRLCCCYGDLSFDKKSTPQGLTVWRPFRRFLVAQGTLLPRLVFWTVTSARLLH